MEARVGASSSPGRGLVEEARNMGADYLIIGGTQRRSNRFSTISHYCCTNVPQGCSLVMLRPTQQPNLPGRLNSHLMHIRTLHLYDIVCFGPSPLGFAFGLLSKKTSYYQSGLHLYILLAHFLILWCISQNLSTNPVATGRRRIYLLKIPSHRKRTSRTWSWKGHRQERCLVYVRKIWIVEKARIHVVLPNQRCPGGPSPRFRLFRRYSGHRSIGEWPRRIRKGSINQCWNASHINKLQLLLRVFTMVCIIHFFISANWDWILN